MADPVARGKVVEVFPEGNYTVSQPVCVIEDVNGKKKELKIAHFWSVRTPRPVIEKL